MFTHAKVTPWKKSYKGNIKKKETSFISILTHI